MATVASAFVALSPTSNGFGKKVVDQTKGPVNKAGKFLGIGFGKIFAAAAGVLAAVGIKKIFSTTTGAFKDLSLEVIQFRRVTGGSVKDASRLRFAVQQSGVDVAKSTTSFTIFAKKLGAAAKDQKKAAALTDLLGASFQNADGSIKPLAQILPGLADKFAKLPDGVEKTALATQLFGRSGTAMIPFLNKGAEGIAELTKKSDELGLTLNQKQIDNFGKYRAAGRELGATFQGLKVTIGSALLPQITRFTTFLISHLQPAIRSTIGWFKETRIIQKFGRSFGEALDRISPVITAITDAAADLLGQVMPSILSLASSIRAALIPVLGDAGKTFQTKVLPAAIDLANYLKSALTPVFVQVVAIVKQLLPVLSSLGQFFYQKIYPAIVATAIAVGRNLQPVFVALIAAIRTQILPLISQLVVKFREWQPTIEKVAIVVLKVVGFLLRLASAILGKVLPVAIRFATFFQVTIYKALIKVVDAIASVVTFIGKIGSAVSTMAAAVKPVLKTLLAPFQKIYDLVVKIVNKIKQIKVPDLNPFNNGNDGVDAAGKTFGPNSKVATPYTNNLPRGVVRYDPAAYADPGTGGMAGPVTLVVDDIEFSAYIAAVAQDATGG